jgi:hypothetical protein
MSDQKGWPDPSRPGVPANPTQAGPHLIIDKYGKRRWGWWTPTSDKFGGAWASTGSENAFDEWTYVGQGKTPDGLPVG